MRISQLVSEVKHTIFNLWQLDVSQSVCMFGLALNDSNACCADIVLWGGLLFLFVHFFLSCSGCCYFTKLADQYSLVVIDIARDYLTSTKW